MDNEAALRPAAEFSIGIGISFAYISRNRQSKAQITAGLDRFGVAMIYLLTAASLIVSLTLWRLLRQIEDKESIKRAMLRGSLEFFIIFTIVGTLYSALQSWIDSAKFDTSDLSTILAMESRIVELRHILLPILDPNKWIEFLIIAILVLLALIAPQMGRLRLVPRTKMAFKWTKRAYILLTALASFTFFGSAIAPVVQQRTAEIKDKIDEVKAGYQSYDAKLDRIARRVVLQSMAKAEPYAQPVITVKQYVRGRNDAIDRVRTRPHNELITFRLDADDFDEQYREEFKKFTAAVSTEQQRVNQTRPSSPPTADIANGTLQQAKVLNANADAILESGDEESDGVLAAVEEATTLLHEETSKKAIEDLVSALSDAAGENELFKLLYEPFLQTPVEEFVKKIGTKLFESTKYGQASLQDELLRAQHTSDEEIKNLALKTDQAEAASIVANFTSATERMGALEANSDNEIASKAQADTQKKLAKFSNEWRSRYSFPGSTVMQRASDADLASAQARVEAGTDALADLQLITEFQAKLTAADGSVLGVLVFEEENLDSHTMRDTIRAAIKPVLAVDEASDWGAIRRAMLGSQVNTSDADTIASINKAMDRIRSWRKRQALEFLLSGKATTVDQDDWEKAFYKFTQQDGEVAALWGWVVKGEYESEVEGRYGRAIPEYGYDYYLEQTHVGSIDTADHLFKEPVTVAFIEHTCSSLGH